jgi:hypothetical protein
MTDILVWHPTQENEAIGACVLLWGHDRTVLATYGHRSREDAEALAQERDWRFEEGAMVVR